MTKKRVITLVLIAIIPLVVGSAIAGASIWWESLNYVNTSSARVSGSQVIVSAPGTANVLALPFDVGDAVQQGQTIAEVDIEPQVGIGGPVGSSVRAPIKAPVDGTIIKRYVHVGDRAAAGAPLFSLVNLNQLYVVADVDEDQVPSIEIGQPVDIYLRAFDKHVAGQVAGLTPATSDLVTTSTATNANSSSGSTTPQVPILIYFDDGMALPVFPGMSAEVSIKIR